MSTNEADNQAKKKRVPKPPLTRNIRVILSLLPWLNLPENPPIGAVVEALAEPLSLIFNEDQAEMPLKFGKVIRERSEDIERARDLILWAVRVACGLPLKDPDMEKVFMRLVAHVAADGNWKPGNILAIPTFLPDGRKVEKRDFENRAMDEFPGALAFFVRVAFSNDQAGYFVGACPRFPRCRKVFEKKRGDQEWCGKICSGSDRSERSRKTRKTQTNKRF